MPDRIRFPAKRQCEALRENLLAGCLLAFRGHQGRFVSCVPQLFLLSALVWSLVALDAFLQQDGPVEWSPYGLGLEAGRAYFTLAALTLSALLARPTRGVLAVLVPCLAASVPQLVVWVLAGIAQDHVTLPESWNPDEILGWVMLVWPAFVLLRVLEFESHLHAAGRWVLGLAYPAVMYVVLGILPSEPLLQPVVEAETDAVDVETIYYSQAELLEQQLAAVEPGQPGHAEFFFVGFASFADEAVFRREVQQAGEIVGSVFGSAHRSVELVNSRRTLDEFPLANRPNLEYVLGVLRGKMQVEEDVLFLFLSSHGTREGELVVDFPSLGLNNLTPSELAKALDDSGIRHRVLVISACYAGAFVPDLASPDTLIITAAASDRTSFGCAHERYWTYFGQAFFEEALPAERDLERAFRRASATVARREQEERKQQSKPQISVGVGIRARLREWETQARTERR